MYWISFSLKHPVSILTIYIAICLFGLLSLTRISVGQLPDIELPEITIVTAYPGMPAREMEPMVTEIIENAVASVSGTQRIESTIQQGITRTSLRFAYGTSMQIAVNAVRQAVDSVYPMLPNGIEYPLVELSYSNRDPVARLFVTPTGDNQLITIAKLIDTEITAAFRHDPSIGSIEVFGLPQREVHINLDPEALTTARVPIGSVASIVAGSIIDRPIGTVRTGDRDEVVIATNQTSRFDLLHEISLKGPGLTVGNVGTVELGTRPSTSVFLANGKPVVGLSIYASAAAGTLQTSRAINQIVGKINRQFVGVLAVELIESAAEPVKKSLLSLVIAIGIGLVSASFVLFTMYRTFSAVVAVVSSVIPSLSAIFFGMYLQEISINLISLSGIAIGIGMILDNAIVVYDAYIGAHPATTNSQEQAIQRVLSATAGSTISTLIVFLPLLFVPGVVGAVFYQLAFGIILLIGISFFSSSTLTPAVLKLLPPSNFTKQVSSRSSSWHAKYRSLARFTLRRRWFSPTLSTVIIGGVLLGGAMIDHQLVPTLPISTVEGIVVLSPETGLDAAKAVAEVLQTTLKQLSATATTAAIGFSTDDVMSKSDPKNRTNRIRFRATFENLVFPPSLHAIEREFVGTALGLGATSARVSYPRDALTTILGTTGEHQYELRAPNRSTLRQRLLSLSSDIAQVNPDAKFKMSSELTTPLFQLALNRSTLALSGVSAGAIVQEVGTMIEGAIVGTIVVDDIDTNVRVWTDISHRQRVDTIPDLHLIIGDNQLVPLSSVATMERVLLPTLVHRVDRQPAYELTLSSPIASVESFSHVAGLTNRSQSAFAGSAREIGIVFLIAAIAMFMSFVIQFESIRTAATILLILPLSTTGGLALLFLFDKSININSILGFLVMFGTVVNGAILLASSIRQQPVGRVPFIVTSRLRPLIATVGTTVASLFPVILMGIRVDTLESHTATAVVGGLVFGTIATVVLLPSLLAPQGKQKR